MELWEYKKALSSKISRRLKCLKISRIEFAQRMNVQPSIVTKWLSGTHNFTLDTLYKIEIGLAFSLMNFNDDETELCDICEFIPLIKQV